MPEIKMDNDITDSFIRALIKADTETVSQMLAERPELADWSYPKRELWARLEELEKESDKGQKKYQYMGLVYSHGPYYDAGDGFRYKQGYMTDSHKGSSRSNELPVRQGLKDLYSRIYNSKSKTETIKPIQLCWAPSHKEIVKLLLSCGAGIDDRTFDRDRNGNLTNQVTLLYNTIDNFPTQGANIDGVREYAEYIKWLISQGASMSFPYYRENAWKTLYETFYEKVIEAYIAQTVSSLIQLDYPGREITEEEKSRRESLYASIEVLTDLTEYIYKDINPDKYIPHDAYESDETPALISSFSLDGVTVFSFLNVLHMMEMNIVQGEINGKTTFSEETYKKLLNIIAYPVEKLLPQFSKKDLQYICQKQHWYLKMANGILKRKTPQSGWQRYWDLLNKYVPAEGMYIGDAPLSDCIRAYGRFDADDVFGKIKAYEAVLGSISESDRHSLWPAIADVSFSIFCKSEELQSKAPDVFDQASETMEELCGFAEQYGAGINRKNPFTGQTPLHILCRKLGNVCSSYKNDKFLSPKDKSQRLSRAVREIASQLEMFKRYGADLSIEDEEGKTPLDAFPKNIRPAIDRCVKQKEYEKSALIEAEDLFIR